jgi:hypothetical protein
MDSTERDIDHKAVGNQIDTSESKLLFALDVTEKAVGLS